MTFHSNPASADQARCPVCAHTVEPADTACRFCGAGLPTANTIAPPPDAPITADSKAALALAEELRQALAPGIQLLRPIGEGGMGQVWQARDAALKRLVAVKVLHPELADDPASRARFAREAETAAAVAHPGVVNIYHVGELPRSGTAYFVMQFVEGKSLQDEIKPGEAMPEPRLRRIVGEIASALAAAHVRGLVHRDIKPANVMLDEESGRVVVLDFGISAALDGRAGPGSPRLTADGHSIGTPMYMSPEQAAARDVTQKSDIYSLGVVAFELATGRPPFTGQTAMELVAAHIKEVPPAVLALRPDLEPRVAELIDRCLAKSPELRPSAADVARALHPETHAAIEWPPPGLEPLRGNGADLAALLGAAVTLGLLFFLVLSTQPILTGPQWYAERFMAFDGTTIWFFALGMLLVALAVALPLIGFRSWKIAGRFTQGLHSGYPWIVLVDVACDRRQDTVALLNGSGAYALLAESERKRMLRLRRLRAALVAATIVAAILSPLLWLAGWTGGWATNREALLPGTEALLLFLPVVAGLAGIVASGRPEERLHARFALPRIRKGHDRAPIRAELVQSWLATIGHSRQAAMRRIPRVLMTAMPPLMILVLGLAAAMVLAISFSVSRELGAARGDALALVRSQRIDSPERPSWQSVDSAISRSAAVPDATGEELRQRVRGGLTEGLLERRIDSSVARGDFRTAVELVRQKLWIGLSIMRSGVGTSDVSRAARRFIEIGQVTHDPALAAEGYRLQARIDGATAGRSHMLQSGQVLMADPSGAGLLPLLRDTTLAPFIRMELVFGIFRGFCFNTREVLFGVDPRRAVVLAEVRSTLPNHPRLVRMMDFYRDAILDPSVAIRPAPGMITMIGMGRSSKWRALDWIGLRGLRARLNFCGL